MTGRSSKSYNKADRNPEDIQSAVRWSKRLGRGSRAGPTDTDTDTDTAGWHRDTNTLNLLAQAC